MDRQHPRDLFDVELLLENEGITTRLKDAFIAYLMSHDRRFLEVLNPTLIDIRPAFETEFRRMTVEPVDVADLERMADSGRTAMIENLKRFFRMKVGDRAADPAPPGARS